MKAECYVRIGEVSDLYPRTVCAFCVNLYIQRLMLRLYVDRPKLACIAHKHGCFFQMTSTENPTDKQQRIYHVLTYLNTAILVGCVLFLVFGSGTQSDKTGIPQTRENFGQQEGTGGMGSGGNTQRANTQPDSSGPSKRAPETLEEMFADIIAPVKRAAVDHQVDPSALLPSQKELDAAVATNSLSSAESQIVLGKLKKGYAQYNMPFPSLGAPPNSDAPPPTQERQVSTNDPKGVEAWLEPTIKRLRDEAMLQKLPIQDLLPTEGQREAAIQSGSFDSSEFREVQTILEDGYAQLNIPFPDPTQKGQAPEGGNPPPTSSQNSTSTSTASSAEQQIINAYFQGQVQRIKLEGKKQDKDVSGCLPDASSIQQAAQSGSISSDPSKALLSKIEACYDILELPFYPPVR